MGLEAHEPLKAAHVLLMEQVATYDWWWVWFNLLMGCLGITQYSIRRLRVRLVFQSTMTNHTGNSV